MKEPYYTLRWCVRESESAEEPCSLRGSGERERTAEVEEDEEENTGGRSEEE